MVSAPPPVASSFPRLFVVPDKVSDVPLPTVNHAQVRQPINARGLGRWRAYES
jgi:hypothetical protein